MEFQWTFVVFDLWKRNIIKRIQTSVGFLASLNITCLVFIENSDSTLQFAGGMTSL